MTDIPLMKPSITTDEVHAVADAVRSGWLSHHGKQVGLFEDEFADFIGIDNAATTSSGTSSIRLALEALGIGRGDEVIVPSLSYIATVSPVVHSGAVPRFVDVRRHDLAMDPGDVKEAITDQTEAIIVAHLYGMSARIEEICKVAESFGISVIEDAAEALGAKTPESNNVGTVGDVGCYSFTGTKILSTGQGGMVVTDSDELYEKINSLKHHGVDRSYEREYRHTEIGFNFCMSNVQAALGRVQLDRFPLMLEARKKVGEMYWERLSEGFDSGYSKAKYMHPSREDDRAVWWHPVVYFSSREERLQAERMLDMEGVEVRRMFYPLPWQEAFDEVRGDAKCEVAGTIYDESLMLPCWPGMDEEQVERVVESIGR